MKNTVKKETTLFEDLINFYENTQENLHSSKKLHKNCVEKETYEMIPTYKAEIQVYEEVIIELKKILKNKFLTEIEFQIPKLEDEYEKQQDYSKSAWDMYGSELAGDFNSGEVKARKKLEMFRNLLK